MTETIDELHRRIKELETQVAYLNDQLKQDDKFGLHWIDVPEAFDKESENKIPILEEVPELAITNDDGKPTHILIEGDNYHALTCLNYTHHGKVDVIYIDPPYNTGSDGFTYKDKRFLDKFPDGAKLPANHPLRHSSWLSFMEKRLRIAKQILSDKGVIFISIDDNEYANLKLLCDDIFGYENFVSNIIWRKQGGGKSDSKFIANNCEYILCYKRKSLDHFTGQDIDTTIFNKVDENGRKYRLMSLDFGSLSYSPSLDYPITLPNGVICYPDCEETYNKRKEGQYNHHDWCWRVSPEEYERRKSIGKIEYTYNKRSQKWKVQERLYLDEKEKGGLYGNLITDFTNRLAKNQLKDIFKKVVFNYPKPTDLISFLVKLYPTNSCTILDFFAGSGTTLHATMKLNDEDGGHRQCILVNSNEGNICREVTYERNKRVIDGYGEEIHLGNSLKYYRTAFVGSNTSSKATDEDKTLLAQKAGCLLALAENTLYEEKRTDNYQIFKDKDRDLWTAVYFKEDVRPKYFNPFVEEVTNLKGKKNVYIFSWGDIGAFESYFDNVSGVSLKGIPQPILDIYKSLNS